MIRGKRVLMALLTATLAAAPAATIYGGRGDNDTWIKAEYREYCEEVGERYCICPEVLEAIIEKESWGVPNVNNGPCVGLMQVNQNIHAERARKLGVSNLYDPYGNILVATDLLSELLGEYDDMALALSHYGGYSNADRLDSEGRMSEYAQKILARSEKLERIHGK